MKRSKHSLSHYKVLSCDMGELVPISTLEVLPGDTFQQATSALIRVSPLLAPVMHPVHVRIHHWFVPYRLLWANWENFITGGPDGFNASAFPTINTTYGAGPPVTGFNTVGSLSDYLGVPPQVNGLSVSALPYRAYALIWNEYYRDQDLQTPLVVSQADGVDTTTNTELQHVAWEKDYFTSARPWTQKGPEVALPLTGNAPITGLGFAGTAANLGGVHYGTSENLAAGSPAIATGDAVVGTTMAAATQNTGAVSGTNRPQVFADLSAVTAATVNDLRLALALQRYEEARANWGSRYVEYLRYLGINPSDARLQRPEYLGGGKQTIQFSEVLQTSPTDDGDDTVGVGNLKGHGLGAVRSNRYRRYFEEHGIVISMLSVRPRTMYVQGLARQWSRRTKEDFFQKELQHIGQQAVFNREVYAQGTGDDAETFGYQDRYDEYRRVESGIAGEFRTTELDFWHMARIFAAPPVLNASFVSSTPTKRINAVQTNDVLWIMCNHSIQARRMVSKTAKSFIF